jgi:hypothetical protein
MAFVDLVKQCRRCGKKPDPRRGERLWMHHVVYEQHVRSHDRSLVDDATNALALCKRCHDLHHTSGPGRIRISVLHLRDANIDFASRLLGRAAGLYFARYYVDSDVDPRIAALGT